MQQIKSQLTIIGAGPAGICAALSAAENGIDTVLICERPVLGGNSSSEIRVWTRGATGAGNLFAEEMGIWGELKLTNLYRNPDANPIFWDETLLDAALSQKYLRLFLNTTVFHTECSDGKVTSLQGVQLGTEKQLSFVSDFYIDCTGDGTIAETAGMKYTVGTSEGTLGSSILYYTKKEDHPVKFIAPDYAYSFERIEQLINHGGRIVSETMSGCDCWWFEYGGKMNTIQDEQDITIELKRLVLGVWNYIKNSGKYAADDYTLEWIGNMAGKRESRRMETEVQLKASDIYQEVNFPDAGFYGGWYVDYHPPGGINDSSSMNCIQRPVHVYQVPLRCLYGKIRNLAVAGRIIGTDSEAFFSSRVMNTCAMSGQAAGTLAAQCIKTGKELHELGSEDFKQIQKQLLRNDMFIPGLQIEDDEDVLLYSQADASSFHNVKAFVEAGEISLAKKAFAVFPACQGKAVMKMRSGQNTSVKALYFTSSLPNRYLKEGTARNLQWKLKKGDNEIAVEIPPESIGKFAVVVFETAEDVYLKCVEKERPGFLCGRTDSSEYFEPYLEYPAAEPKIYGPANVTDGYTRIWNSPHAWLAAKGDANPWITVMLKHPQVLKEIRVFLDPDLSMELVNSRTEQWRADHKYTKRDGMPAQLIRSMKVTAFTEDGAQKTLAEIKENFRRLVIIPVNDESRIKMIRLDCIETWGGRSPVIYEICAYPK